MFPIIGMKMFPKVFARVACWQSSSFNVSNSSETAFSRVNTCTTFCPLIISSMYPLMSPKDFCWRTNERADAPPIFLVRYSMRTTIRRTSTVSGMLMEIIAKNTATIVIIEDTICGTLCDIICRRVSVSLV